MRCFSLDHKAVQRWSNEEGRHVTRAYELCSVSSGQINLDDGTSKTNHLEMLNSSNGIVT